jgi:hypothetical protein
LSSSSSASRLTDFMCDCQDEGKQQCAELMKRVYADLNLDEHGRAEDGFNFLSAVVYCLEWTLPNEVRGTIVGMSCDMWAEVAIDLWRPGNQTVAAHIGVQCDKLEHGLARAWELANEFAQNQDPEQQP